MEEAEALAFEAEPHAALAVTVRRYDDMGKVPDMITPDLESFVPLLKAIADPPSQEAGRSGRRSGNSA